MVDLARRRKAELYTGDPEFKAVAKEVKIAWLYLPKLMAELIDAITPIIVFFLSEFAILSSPSTMQAFGS